MDARQGHARQSKQRGAYAWTDRQYGRMLEWSLAHRRTMLAVAAAVVASVVLLFPYVGKELVPDDDQSEFSVNVRLPRGTSYQRSLEYIRPIEREIRQVLGDTCVAVLASLNSGGANYWVQLTPLDERARSQQELMAATRRMLSKYKNARISVSGGTDISGASSSGGRGGGGSTNRLSMIVQGPDMEQLQVYSQALLEKIREISPASPTPTPASRRRSRSCGSQSTASGRPTSACPSTPSRRASARWWAARRCRASRTATSGTRCACASTSPSGATPRRWATCSCRRAAGGWCA